MPVDKVSIEKFAQTIKDKYPQYKDIDDTLLTNSIIEKHPEYKDMVDFNAKPAFKANVDINSPLGMISNPQRQGPTPIDQANDRIANEIQNSDKAIGSLLSKQKINEFKQKLDDFRRNDGKGSFPTPDFSFTTNARDQQAATLKQILDKDPAFARQVLEEQGNVFPEKKGQIQADVYQLDRGVENPKIFQNVEKIKNNELEYNIHNKTLQKPEDFWQALSSSYNDRIKSRNDYDEIMASTPQQLTHKLEAEYQSYDPDEPVNTPKGLGHLGRMIGGQPPQAILAGAGVSLVPGAEEAAPWAAALVASPEIHAVSYANGLKSTYKELRDQGVDPAQATVHAQQTADFNANVDMAQGALMTAASSRLLFKPAKINLSEGFMNAVTKGTEQAIKSTASEALPQGLLASGLQAVKNLHAGKPLGEGVAEAGAETAATMAALALIIKAPEVLAKAPKIYNQLKQGLINNPAKTNVELAHMVKDGNVTPQEANQVTGILQQHAGLDNQIPAHIDDENTRLQIQDLITHKTKLEGDLENLNKAYHPAIKSKIADIDEQIQKLSDLPVKEKPEGAAPKPAPTQGEKKLVGMPEDISPRIELSTKTNTDESETEKADAQTQVLGQQQGAVSPEPAPILEQAKGLIQKGIDEGHIPNEYQPFTEHPDHILDFINEQIQAGKEPHMRNEFGHELVDLAKNKQPTELLESRHADTNNDEKGITSGPNQDPLSKSGKRDSNDLANDVADKGVKKIISSDLERAKETAQIVADKTGAKVEHDPNLRTWDIGEFDGSTDKEFKRVQDYFVNHPDAKDFEGKKIGETFNQYKDRVIKARTELEKEPASTLLINHSNNMMLWDAYKKNGREWNEQAAKDYINGEKPEPATLTTKNNNDAIPIGQSASMGAHSNGPESVGGEGEGSGMGSSLKGNEPPKQGGPEENEGEGKEGQVISTKNAVTEALRKDNGLPPVEIPKDRSTDESLNAWRDGTRHPLEIVDQLLGDKNIYDKAITPNDEPIMREYIRGLNNRGIELNKENEALEAKVKAGDKDAELEQATVKQQLLNHYDQMQRALDAERIGGNIWHKYGEERQIAVNEKGQVLNSINRIKTIYGDDMPPVMKEKLSELQKKYDSLVAKNTQIEESLKQKTAEAELLKQQLANKKAGNKSKKSSQDFSNERKDILADMKEALKKARGNAFSTIPGVPELSAIAPHVLKLFRSFGEQGIDKLGDMIEKIHDVTKEALDGITKENIRDILAGKHSEKKPLSELTKKLNDLRSQAKIQTKIEDLENGISIATKKYGDGSPETQALKKQLAEVKKQSVNEYANLSAEQVKKQAEAIQRQIDKGEYFKMPLVKKKWENDPEWRKNEQQKADLKLQLRNLEQQAYDSKKSMYMRGLDWINRWGRRIIFFGANAVYTKLSSAAVLGSFIHRPFEQGMGLINKELYPHIAKNAPIEGNINMAAEAKFYKEFLNPKKFAQNVWSQARYGETPLSKELGRHSNEKHIPIVDLFAADAHAMIKDPVKRATFEASVLNHLKFYADNSIDGTHPLMLESARQAAYKTAEYEIFQNSNSKGKGISHFFNELEKTGVINNMMPDTWNKIKGNAQYTAASLYHFFVPINTVPSNILNRVGLGLKTPLTMVEAMSKNKAIREGILNMNQEESDLIMRQLKKGQIGTAYWTLGFILGGSVVGGLYTKYDPDKERTGALTNELKVGGMDVPKDVQHNTQLQSLQMGGTWKTVYSHYINDKGASQLKALAAATAATTGAALESLPPAEAAAKAYEAAKTPYGGQKFIDDLKRRVGIGKATNLAKLMGYESTDETDAEKQQEKEHQKTTTKLSEWRTKLKITDKAMLPSDIEYDHSTPKPNDAQTKELNGLIETSRQKLFKEVSKDLDFEKMSDSEKKTALETVMKEGEETAKEAFKAKYPQFTPKRPEMTDEQRQKEQEQSEKERDIQRKIFNKARELKK